MPGYLVHSADVPVVERGSAAWRVAIDESCGCPALKQAVVAFAPGRSTLAAEAGRERSLYVSSGRGSITLDGVEHALEPDTGVYLAPGAVGEVTVTGPEDLVVVAVDAPPPTGIVESATAPPATVRLEEQEFLPATAGRTFRYVIDPTTGGRCGFTQFVGEIPPGRAPEHNHTYDEVVYVLAGEGVLHLGEQSRPISAGSCIHLPPLTVHCLENTGDGSMRVLGVFHPAGDPASRVYTEGES